MKNKKGFTLVELLAVIAVLAIILLLIVPNIVDMFNNGKKDAFVRQVQSVWREAEKEYAADLTTDNKTSLYNSSGTTLKLNKTDITYIVSLDDHGVINYIAVGDKNYCYISDNPSTMDITREDITESSLSCEENTCTCGSITSSAKENDSQTYTYRYWNSYYSGYSSNLFDMSYDSFTKMYEACNGTNYNGSFYFIRTKVDKSGNTYEDEACITKDNSGHSIVCVGPDYHQGNQEETINKLRNDLINAGFTSVNCNDRMCNGDDAIIGFYFDNNINYTAYSTLNMSCASQYYCAYGDYCEATFIYNGDLGTGTSGCSSGG